ncbi:MAG: hypothetical protein IJ313_09400 [Clostridia bacterium]|nr:hypothetical protein [Clostridia bacterium]
MTYANCNCRCRCTVFAAIASAILGVLAAFFQITGLITITPIFLWVAFGIAVVYLGVLVISSALADRAEQCMCVCSALSGILLGILGTILFAVILLAFGVVATSVITAILVGLLVFFFALMLTNTACLVRHLSDCGN